MEDKMKEGMGPIKIHITTKLIRIQEKLNAPKNQFNKFGGYPYRSCEDIIEAVKPLLVAEELALLLSDEIVEVGSRVYVKATAKISGNEGINLQVSAYAREPESKKGMDASQITGATSSYARKYALNGLFAIDDTKDADTMDNMEPAKTSAKIERNWIKELEVASTLEELRGIFAEAYPATKGEEKAKVKMAYDKKKIKLEGE